MFRSRLNAVMATAVFSFLLLVTTGWSAADQGDPVRAGTPCGRELHAPAAGESFDFVIFGDHKGGPVESIKVLRDAIKMTNYFDPDFVMTVGDLVAGYGTADSWMADMREFTQAMNVLKMPWYPVAGNHDVYTRPSKPGGHTDLYKEHFGPLYYSFDYKWAHVIVLFSDEQFSFRNPAENQNFSVEQIDWIRNDLKSTDARQVFVFLHHPRWISFYDGCNWGLVHRMFVEDGRDFTVFAGHKHVYRSDGKVDNVEYYTLATTGGRMQEPQETASLHHVDFVRVRPDRVAVAVVPVGAVYAGDFVKGFEVDTMAVLLEGEWFEVKGRALLRPSRNEKSAFSLVLNNPTDRQMSVHLAIEADASWGASTNIAHQGYSMRRDTTYGAEARTILTTAEKREATT